MDGVEVHPCAIEDAEKALLASKWTFAKTMAHNPHEWTLRKTWDQPVPFEQVVMAIRTHGRSMKFGRSYYTVYDIGAYRYWTMGNPLHDDQRTGTTLINRAVNSYTAPDGSRFLNRDIMKLPKDVATGCDFTWTDPPWGPGLVKMFETMMHKATGRPRPGNSEADLLYRLFDLAPRGKPTFIEYSVKGHDAVLYAAAERGFELSRVIEARQSREGNGMPFVICVFNSDWQPEGDASGFDLVAQAMTHHKPQRVFEPFAGLGKTTEVFLRHGAAVVASELNPDRYEKMIKRVGKQRDLTPGA